MSDDAQSPVSEESADKNAAPKPATADEAAGNDASELASAEKKKAQVNRMGTASVGKLMLEFAVPSIIGLVCNGLYNVVSAVFLGNAVGQVGLAVTTAAMPIMIMGMALSVLIGAGGNALTALRLGEGKHKEAEHVIGNAFTMTFIMAILAFVLVNILMDPILTLIGTPAGPVWDATNIYVRILSAGFIFQFYGMGFNNFIRTAGDPNRALYTMVAGAASCIFFNWLFVTQLGWGVQGSALATISGQAVSAVLVLWYFLVSKKAPFKVRLHNLKIKPRLVGNILALGFASFALQAANAIINLLLNNQLNFYGAMDPLGSVNALAAIGVTAKIVALSFFPLLGVAMAAQPIFGYNYGAHNFNRVKKTYEIALVWVVAIGVFFWIIVHTVPGPIVTLFGVSEQLKDFTVFALQVQMFFMPLIGVQVITSNYFQSSGQPLKAMFLSLTRQIIYLIPLLYFLPLVIQNIVPSLTPLDGLYFSYPVADILSVATSGTMMLVEIRRLNRMMKKQEQDEKDKELMEKPANQPSLESTQE
jgi:putative MATE family efflux protein